jgi:hypothetical protein
MLLTSVRLPAIASSVSCVFSNCSGYKLSLSYLGVARLIVLLGLFLPVCAYAGSVMTLPSSFAVDHMGSATLNVPIAVPPGTAGMTPDLALSYSSSNGNGYVGVGWTLTGLPAITRCPATIATDGSAEPVTFQNGANGPGSYDPFCFQGKPLVQAQQQSEAGQQTSGGQQFSQQLIGLSGSAYGADGATYGAEIEDFSQIVSHTPGGYNGPSSFTVFTRSGLIYEFGGNSGTTNAQVLCTQAPNCAAGTTVMSWLLDKVTDTAGNTINITYAQDAGNARAYPSVITYTANAGQGLAAINQITFGYIKSRADAPMQFMAGQQMQTNWLLQTVTTANGGPSAWTNVSTYTLGYTSGLTGRSQLNTITRAGAAGGTLLPASFSYCDVCGAPADLLASFDNGLSGPTTVTYALTTHSSV